MTSLNLFGWPLVFAALCLIACIQLGYFAIVFSRLAFYRQKPRSQSQQHPVSVIVCARDEAANLARNIPGVLVQTYPSSHEVIVVNDNSADESKYFLEALQKDYRQLQVIELKQEAKLIPGKKFPLSIGIKTAKYEIVLLTDADCMPASDHWMEKMQSGFTDNIEIVLGYGAYNKTKTVLNRLIRFETFHTALQYLSYAIAGMPYMGVGRNLAYKRAVFFRNKGFSAFNHIPSGDDDLFINRAATGKNTAVVIDEEAHTLSAPKETWGEWFRQKNRHFSTGKYYKGLHKFLLGLYAFSQFMFYPLLILSLLYYNWKLALAVYGIKLCVQGFIYYKAMKQLNEKDLWVWFPLLDLWMFFYYLIFFPAMLKKPRVVWK